MAIVQRDKNSAYPWACTLLPCLLHGSWNWTTSPVPGGWYIGKYAFSHASSASGLYHLPIRDRHGGISWPRAGQGWYWSCEVEAAARAGAQVRSMGVRWEFVSKCDCRPYAFVHELYEERRRIGKSGRGLVIKLALNSIYGKKAQSIGSAPYANPIEAGMITALMRAALIDDYVASGMPDCLMLATDGLFYTDALGEFDRGDVGTGLGQWDEVVHDDGMFIIQPGLYFVSSEMGKPKTRGVPQSAVVSQLADFEQAWTAYLGSGAEPLVDVPVRTFVGLRLAASRGRLETAGSWVDGFKAVRHEWRTKRSSLFDDASGVRSRPRDVDAGVTVPYAKIIGGLADMDQLERDEQPDWVEWFEDTGL